MTAGAKLCHPAGGVVSTTGTVTGGGTGLKGEVAMKVKKMDHFCIAVKDLEAARKIWEPVLGRSEPDERYVDEPEQIRVARYMLDGAGFELMESTSPDGPVARWIEKNGEGIMLIGFNVENRRFSLLDHRRRIHHDCRLSRDLCEDRRRCLFLDGHTRCRLG